MCLDLSVRDEDGILSIHVTIPSEQPIVEDDLMTMQSDLEIILEQPINLTIEAQQVSTIAITAVPTPEPEATDEADD